MIAPLAHAGHWLESAAFALPPLTLIAALLVLALVGRRRAGGESSSGRRGPTPDP